jgi:hypothetical protein
LQRQAIEQQECVITQVAGLLFFDLARLSFWFLWPKHQRCAKKTATS